MLLETSCGHLRAFVTDPRSIKTHSLISTANNMLIDLLNRFFNSSSLESLKSSAILWDFCLHERLYFRKGLNVKR